MEKLCQLFEAGSERVDLSDLPPHLISSCLKLYFRQVGREREGERDFGPFQIWPNFPIGPWTIERERERNIYIFVCTLFAFFLIFSFQSHF